MSQQALDLRTSMRIVRRHKFLLAIVIMLGVLAGGGYTVRYPPMLTSTALVVLPQTAQNAPATGSNGGTDPYTATQEVVAGSDAVLTNALPNVRPQMSLSELLRVVQVGSLTPFVISISAKSKVAADAEATANAVARSYISYVGSASSPVGRVSAQLLEPATSATGSTLAKQLAIFIVLGGLVGGLAGVVIALAIGRGDWRLRERDAIADSIGVPVLVSVPSEAPRDAAGWIKLLQDYRPEPVAAWRLHKTLCELGLISADPANSAAHAAVSLVVLSLASDHHALALAPQFAAFAASLGIRTALVLGPQQDTNATASLRAACTAPTTPLQSGNLQIAVFDHGQDGKLPDAALTVIVAVVDDQSPKVTDTMRGTVAVLGVSSGAATAGQLARVAANAAADGHEITGILVADPDPTDTTTGLMPNLARPGRRPPRLSGLATQIRKQSAVAAASEPRSAYHY
jgi:capsular polysaccharide biosynthesis protein